MAGFRGMVKGLPFSLSRNLPRSAKSGSSVSAWTPSLLFSSGQRGAYYDPSDLSTLFQDSAGTVPVTAVGQPVGKMLDKSGRGYHLTQSNSTAQRPTYQTDVGGFSYLQFVPNSVLYGQANNNNIFLNNSMLLCTAHRFDSTADGTLIGRSYSNANAGRWFSGRGGGGSLRAIFDKDGVTVASVDAASDTSTSIRVVSAVYDRSAANPITEFLNAANFGVPTGVLNTTAVNMIDASKYFRMGAYGDASDHFNVINGETIYFTGRIYAACFVFDTIVPLNLAKLQTWCGSKCGLAI